MRMDKFTIKAQEAIQQAQQLAEGRQNLQVDVEHLLSALLVQPDGLTVPLLTEVGRQYRSSCSSRSKQR